jgi:outer membrane protein
MQLKNTFLIGAASLFLSSSVAVLAAEPVAKPSSPQETFPTTSRFAVYNPRRCAEESKMGREAESTLMNLKDQLSSQLEPIQKELMELVEKGRNADYMESLSMEARRDLEKRFQELSAEFDNKREQFDEILNEAKGRAFSQLNVHMERAGHVVGREKGIETIARNEAFLIYPHSIDVTTPMIVELDKIYDREMQGASSKSETPKK